MVDVVRVKPPEQVLGRPLPKGGPAPFPALNLKRSSRCRPAAGAAGRHMTDNHRSQVPKVLIGRMR
jgi:hypothetical protein